MIHTESPFAPDPEDRDPVRRFRGRLTSPVTIVTSGPTDRRTALTVSSLSVAEGEPGLIQPLIGPTSDLWSSIADTGKFVVHICSGRHRRLSEVFAGLRPSPGGVFAGVSVTQSEWGPVIDDIGDRAYCSVETQVELGYAGVVTGRVDTVDVGDLVDPLVRFRGAYRSLA